VTVLDRVLRAKHEASLALHARYREAMPHEVWPNDDDEPAIEVDIPWELRNFRPPQISVAELLEMYDTSLNLQTVAIFSGIAATVVLISTVVPVIVLLKTNPKQVLL